MTRRTGSTAQVDEHGRVSRLFDSLVNSPVAGILPWIVMSLLSGPGRFELSVAIAFALSLAFLIISHRRHQSVKPMEVFDLAFFTLFFIAGIVTGHDGRQWMETWAGEITNVVLMVFVLITILVRHPFTLAYAREQTPREFWDSKPFLRINYAIAWAWFISFALQTAMGWYADGVLGNSNELWWGWVLPFAPMVAAVVFTEAYPDYVRGRARGDQPAPSPVVFFEWIAPFVVICGVIGLLTGQTSTAVGVGLIVVGAIASGLLNRRAKARTATPLG